MIPDDVLVGLLPLGEVAGEFDDAMSEAARLVSGWASILRERLRQEIQGGRYIARLVETSGFVGVGIFRTSGRRRDNDYSGFPVVDGYQFGAVLLRAQLDPEFDGSDFPGVAIDRDLFAPLVQFVAHTDLHTDLPDGRVAAYFVDDDGTRCAITARHVVEHQMKGQRVPVLCTACGRPARLRRRAPGLIDAAAVELVCGGPPRAGGPGDFVRLAREGETVRLYLDSAFPRQSTVMLALQTNSELRTAAVPRHFLTSESGHGGDSGSLVSGDSSRDLCGMYLGSTVCEDERGWSTTYGYALDLRQAADVLGATSLTGAFNG
jgi:hypothetical protein